MVARALSRLATEKHIEGESKQLSIIALALYKERIVEDCSYVKPKHKYEDAHDPACNPSFLHIIIPTQMEHLDIIFLPFALLAALALGLAVWAVIKFRKLYENKSEIPGLLDDSGLPEEEMCIQFSEQPTFDVY